MEEFNLQSHTCFTATPKLLLKARPKLLLQSSVQVGRADTTIVKFKYKCVTHILC